MKGISVSAPWVTFSKKIMALFEEDPEITVEEIGEDGRMLKIVTTNTEKFWALCKLLPHTKKFGNVLFGIEIIYRAEAKEERNTATYYRNLFSTLFEGNRSVKEVLARKDGTGSDHVFVVFEPEVKQFFNDNLFDLNGFWTGLSEDIAEEVFEKAADQGVHFCTAKVWE